MDRETLFAFKALWVCEDQSTLRELTRLNAEESALYDDFRNHRRGRNLRLEQERMGSALWQVRVPSSPANAAP